MPDKIETLGFCITQKAWYASSLPESRQVDEVIVGRYEAHGDSTLSIMFEWPTSAEAEFTLASDAWEAIAVFSGLFGKLAQSDRSTITLDAFVALLLSLGFEDKTPYVDDDKTCP
jgi:hypothetical protein